MKELELLRIVLSNFHAFIKRKGRIEKSMLFQQVSIASADSDGTYGVKPCSCCCAAAAAATAVSELAACP